MKKNTNNTPKATAQAPSEEQRSNTAKWSWMMDLPCPTDDYHGAPRTLAGTLSHRELCLACEGAGEQTPTLSLGRMNQQSEDGPQTGLPTDSDGDKLHLILTEMKSIVNEAIALTQLEATETQGKLASVTEKTPQNTVREGVEKSPENQGKGTSAPWVETSILGGMERKHLNIAKLAQALWDSGVAPNQWNPCNYVECSTWNNDKATIQITSLELNHHFVHRLDGFVYDRGDAKRFFCDNLPDFQRIFDAFCVLTNS